MSSQLCQLSQSLDRQIYSMQSSRGSHHGQSKTIIDSYQRFFDETLNKIKEERNLISQSQERLRKGEEDDKLAKAKLREDKQKMKESLTKQMEEKTNAQVEAKIKEASNETDIAKMPEHVLNVYPRFETQTKVSPKEELKMKKKFVKEVLEKQIIEKKEKKEVERTQQENKNKLLTQTTMKQFEERDEKEQNQRKETKKTLKQELECQMEVNKMKHDLTNCLYGIQQIPNIISIDNNYI